MLTDHLSFDVRLNQPYEQAMQGVADALQAEGFGVLTTIDVRATFKAKISEDFRPYAILGVCNPPLAFRALSRSAQAGLMLPCTITVEAANDSGCIVRIVDPATLLAAAGMGQDQVLREVADEAASRLERVARALSDL